MAEEEYYVLTRIHQGGKWHDIGATVNLTKAEAEKFLKANAVKAVDKVYEAMHEIPAEESDND